MRILLQRVKEACVKVDGEVTGQINHGLLIFVGFAVDDDQSSFGKMTDKFLNLRIFDDENGRPDRSVSDEKGGILIVSQFTLYADCKKGRRPSWSGAMPPLEAEKLYLQFVEHVRKTATDMKIETGKFGAMMEVSLINDGPVTIWLDSSVMIAS